MDWGVFLGAVGTVISIYTLWRSSKTERNSEAIQKVEMLSEISSLLLKADHLQTELDIKALETQAIWNAEERAVFNKLKTELSRDCDDLMKGLRAIEEKASTKSIPEIAGGLLCARMLCESRQKAIDSLKLMVERRKILEKTLLP